MKLRTVEMEAPICAVDKGVTNPLIISADDGEKYILKHSINKEGKNYNATLVNEVLAYQIGSFLEVPMPEMVFVHVDGTLMELNKRLFFAYRLTEGTHVGSLQLENVENNEINNMQLQIKMGKPYLKRPWNTFFEKIDNKEDIAAILAFDLLISNFDRYNNTGNVIIDESNGRKIYAIDHGHAFRGAIWKPLDIEALAELDDSKLYVERVLNWLYGLFRDKQLTFSRLGPVFDSLEKFIDLTNLEEHSFQEVVSRIECISEELINSWLDDIPHEWYINEQEQKNYYRNFLLMSKDAVRRIIQVLAENMAFTNYRGGVLKWKERQSLNTAL